jgi:hypothetical protein
MPCQGRTAEGHAGRLEVPRVVSGVNPCGARCGQGRPPRRQQTPPGHPFGAAASRCIWPATTRTLRGAARQIAATATRLSTKAIMKAIS